MVTCLENHEQMTKIFFAFFLFFIFFHEFYESSSPFHHPSGDLSYRRYRQDPRECTSQSTRSPLYPRDSSMSQGIFCSDARTRDDRVFSTISSPGISEYSRARVTRGRSVPLVTWVLRACTRLLRGIRREVLRDTHRRHR